MKEKEIKLVKTNDDKLYLFLKRIIDICGAIVGLIIFSPVCLIVSILIKREDPKGNIIFAQERVGINGQLFNMYKFRSMVSNAEELLDELQDKNEMDGPVFKIKDDPRITKIGKIIRKTSLDELPQFVNVLKGDMSLVGPRPPIQREVDCYSEYEMQRLLVKPGITCYWQIQGRNNILFDEWMRLDLKYISERNIFIDIKIILQTALKLFGDKNAS